MPITTEKVRFVESQRLTDYDDGGGFMTAKEVVDGNINNLFPDISRLDRTYGRVSLRKMFLHVQTDDVAVASGAHVAITRETKDENISVCMFTTDSPSDNRKDARDFLESYVTLGPRFPGWLYGDQPAGARALLVFMPMDAPLPKVSSVLCLFNDKGQVTEYRQYVRVVKVEAEGRQFNLGGGQVKRKVVNITIANPLEKTFKGVEVMKDDNVPTSIYTTLVSDAARYYGVMEPVADLKENDTILPVDSI
ncbi:MAG: hypothetical protein CSB24_00800 [Deltaproteobacteria bacterium]|nr:MAG: hypothetical protein CSB24_00800 [Deltaproteobacteria bacterium]